jgi:hypothetical protein
LIDVKGNWKKNESIAHLANAWLPVAKAFKLKTSCSDSTGENHILASNQGHFTIRPFSVCLIISA